MARTVLVLTAVLLALLAFSSPASAATCTFNSGTTVNWTSGGCASGDDAVISSNTTVQVTAAQSITGVTISSGTIQFSGGFTLTNSGGLTINTGTGTVTGNGTLTVAGTYAASTQFSISDRADVVLNGGGSQTGGSICLTDSTGTGAAGDPHIDINSLLKITSTASTSPFSCNGGDDGAVVRVNNGGTLENDLTGAATIFTPMTVANGGTLHQTAGTLSLNGGTGGVNPGGHYSVDASSTLAFASSHTLVSTAAVDGAGAVSVQGSVTVPLGATWTISTLTIAGGTLALNNTATTYTPATITFTASGTIAGTRNITPTGAVTINGGTSEFKGAFTVTIGGTASLSWATNNQLSLSDGVDLVLNKAVTQSQGNVCLTDSTGTGVAGDPHIDINALYTIGVGAFSSPFNCNGGDDGAVIRVNSGGTLENDIAGSSTIFTPMTVANGGTLHQTAGTLSFNGGTGGAVPGGHFSVDAFTTLAFASNFTLAATAAVDGAGAVTVQASVNVPLGATWTIPALSVAGGMLTLNNTATTYTPVSITFGGGTLAGTRNITPTGAVTINGGSGEFKGAFTVTIGGTASLSWATNNQLGLSDGVDLVLNKAVTQSQGNVCMTDSTGTGLPGDPHIDINALYTIGSGAFTSPFNCNGGDDGAVIRVNSGGTLENDIAGAATIFTPLSVANGGTLHQTAGTLSLNGGTGGVNPGGHYSVDAASTLALPSNHTFASTAAVDGAGSVTVQATVTVPLGATWTIPALTIAGGMLTLNNTATTYTPATITFTGGMLAGTRNITPTGAVTINGGSGEFKGAFTVTIGGTASLSWATNNQLGLSDGVDLVLNKATTLSQGNICLTDSTGTGLAGDPHIDINAVFTIGSGAFTSPFNCNGGDDGAVIRVNGTGTLDDQIPGAIDIFGRLQISGTFSLASGQVVHTNDGFDQTGGSTTIASGATFSGSSPKNISGGTVTANGTFAGSTVTVTNAGVVKGTGHVGGDFQNTSGTVAPGNSAGTLTVDNDYTQGSSGTLQIEVNGTTAGTQFDVLQVDGSATVDGTLAVVQGGGFVAQNGDTFLFMPVATNHTGQFSQLTGNAISGGGTYDQESVLAGFRLKVGVPAPTNDVKPAVTGAATAGQAVTCDPGQWTGSPTFTYEWLRDGSSIGVTTQQYTLTSSDAGHSVACRVVGTNGAGSSAPVTSDPVSVPPLPPSNSSPPSVSGSGVVGQTLTCDPGGWSGSPSFTFQWFRDGSPIGGAILQQYTLTSDDAGHSISCRVTGSNGGGTADATSGGVAVSAQSSPPPPPPEKPSNTTKPSVPGTGKSGDTIRCDPGTWTGGPTLAFAWLRDGSPIPGAVGQTYTLTPADDGHAIVCRVTATNPGGTAQASSPQLVVQLAKPAETPPTKCGAGQAGGNSVCLQGPQDLAIFGCVRIGNFQHRFPIALKKKVKGVTVNRLSRVTVVIFKLDSKPNGKDSKRPFFAVVDGTKLTPGSHTLKADVRLQVPTTKKKFRKQFSFTFKTCG